MAMFSVKQVTGKHVLLWMVGFFAVIIAVNGTMAALAISTFNGLTKETAYVDGLAYNKTLAAIDAQQALGWTVDTTIDRPGDRQVGLTMSYKDSGSTPINRLNVRAEFVRPVSEGSDFTVPLAASGDGLYQVTTEVPLPGQWSINIVASREGQAPYIVTHRSVIR